MKFELAVTVDLESLEQERLKRALRADSGSLQQALARLAGAATNEVLDQVLARRLPARMKDVRELRLLHYSLSVNYGRLPSTDQIADLFHLTTTEASTLHRNTRTRYSFELVEGLNIALRQSLLGAFWVPDSKDIGGYLQINLDHSVFEHAEHLLRWGGSESVPRISADTNYGDYRVPLSAMRRLCQALSLDRDAVLSAAKARRAPASGSLE